jgi:hypothetical protein
MGAGLFSTAEFVGTSNVPAAHFTMFVAREISSRLRDERNSVVRAKMPSRAPPKLACHVVSGRSGIGTAVPRKLLSIADCLAEPGLPLIEDPSRDRAYQSMNKVVRDLVCENATFLLVKPLGSPFGPPFCWQVRDRLGCRMVI